VTEDNLAISKLCGISIAANVDAWEEN